MPRSVNLKDVAVVARRLALLDTRFVFTGGAVIALLLDRPELSPVRATKDVDVIGEARTRVEYTDLEERLRRIGFRHDTSEGAPICRWIADDVRVDVMPMRDPTGTMSDRWFEMAVASSQSVQVIDETIPIASAPCFVAMKIDAFNDRGGGDFAASHDMEDLLVVVDGRDGLAAELLEAPRELREFVAGAIRRFLADSRFIDSLPGHLAPDTASQQGLPSLVRKLQGIAGLSRE